MSRTLLSSLVVFASALAILLGGCGGGGGGGNSGGSTDGGNTGGTGSGQVRAIDGTPLAGATVKFYGAGSGVVLASGTVAADGSLPTTVPLNATRFSVDATALENGSGVDLYWTTYAYSGTYFDDSTGCYAPLPRTGSTKGFENDIIFLRRVSTSTGSASPPPPPPTGCVG